MCGVWVRISAGSDTHSICSTGIKFAKYNDDLSSLKYGIQA